jgi:NAD(P)-dependent dehydrogenase (short-subunit alcohol dehydrogenase family)/acyl carrier protein
VRPRERSDYEALLGELEESGRRPDRVAHLWCVGEGPEGVPTEDLGFHSLLGLIGALAGRGVAQPLRIEVVSSGVQSVTGEESVEPEKALVLGPVRVAPQEIPNLACRSIDVDLPERESRRERARVNQLVAELTAATPAPAESAIAYRGGHRWVQGFEAARLPGGATEGGLSGLLRPGCVYLITGGLGGVGLALAEHLARTTQAKLVLVGRSPFPAREDWEGWLARHEEGNRTSRRIRRLLAIEELGAEVLAASADVCEPAQVSAVLEEARRRFGVPLRGVIHAAGVASGGMVQLKTPEAAAEVLAPKVRGTRVLAAALEGKTLDFLVLCSAVNSVLGGFGRVDFCAASAFLDAFALQRSAERDGLSLAIGWDTWSETGVVAEGELPPDLEEVRRESLKHGMLTHEALEVFDRALRSGLPQVTVSTRDLAGLLARQRSAAAAAEAEAPKLAASHSRPMLGTAYVAPATETERRIAGVWEEFLGIQGIGAHDNFFELGGHSLMATQITSRLRDTFKAELTIARFFAEPTVAGLAAALASQPAGGAESEGDEGRMARLLSAVEELSEAELDALLAAEERRP